MIALRTHVERSSRAMDRIIGLAWSLRSIRKATNPSEIVWMTCAGALQSRQLVWTISSIPPCLLS